MDRQMLKEPRQETERRVRTAKPKDTSARKAGQGRGASRSPKKAVTIDEHVVEIISDSGEGAQRCGQSFGSVAARMGNGIWTVEIIPAEIQPPARSIAGASGNRIRIASQRVTNGGDEADLVVAFNEQVLLGRYRTKELKPGCTILLEDKWRTDPDPDIAVSYAHVYDELLCNIYSLDLEMAREQIRFVFRKKDDRVIDLNLELLEAGHEWAEANLDIRYSIPASKPKEPQIVMNGNTALALGVLASGMEVCAMYPITPATSASHYLSDIFERVGCVVHQAEDEIAACAFAIGASYAGKCAVTITSGPGLSLKQEGIGLAVMSEIPLVVVDVQRGGPSTGQPTKAEQGDLLSACFGGHGDGPKVVMAASTIEDCFYSVIMARKVAETFNMVVVVLTDASLATAQQPFPRPDFNEQWLAPPIDQSAVPEGASRYDWDPQTGLAHRFIPGQPNGMHCLTGLAHDRLSHVAYDPEINQEGIRNRSLKLATFQKTLKAPAVFGEEEGEMLLVGWGSTKGAIEEAVERLSAEGKRVSSLHLKFLQPMPSGLKEVFRRFDKVMTVENTWSDSLDREHFDEDSRRYAGLALLLRARFLVDVDCWGEVKGQPIKPGKIVQAVLDRLS
jgi:2-oxoglutarate ferredoxin oxidoreductase subunit alpha